jgi:hypothetical protein
MRGQHDKCLVKIKRPPLRMLDEMGLKVIPGPLNPAGKFSPPGPLNPAARMTMIKSNVFFMMAKFEGNVSSQYAPQNNFDQCGRIYSQSRFIGADERN